MSQNIANIANIAQPDPAVGRAGSRAPSIRVGVDVGGTFTKAVAVEVRDDGAHIVAQSVRPTTHDDEEGVAAGVVHCVADVARAVGPSNVALVTHSTTQAVNALLEGDVGTVGVIGLGRRPELKRARERTERLCGGGVRT